MQDGPNCRGCTRSSNPPAVSILPTGSDLTGALTISDVPMTDKKPRVLQSFLLCLARFSLTLNLTILLTRVSGRGLPRGNWMVPLDTLYGDNSS